MEYVNADLSQDRANPERAVQVIAEDGPEPYPGLVGHSSTPVIPAGEE